MNKERYWNGLKGLYRRLQMNVIIMKNYIKKAKIKNGF